MVLTMITQSKRFLSANLFMKGPHWYIRIGINLNWPVINFR